MYMGVAMTMTIFRVVVTVLSFSVFVGLVAWVYAPKRRSSFEQMAQTVLGDET
jgi:cbb3-type cytochrome oxidase subunit 3